MVISKRLSSRAPARTIHHSDDGKIDGIGPVPELYRESSEENLAAQTLLIRIGQEKSRKKVQSRSPA